jgi:hypothetical protein
MPNLIVANPFALPTNAVALIVTAGVAFRAWTSPDDDTEAEAGSLLAHRTESGTTVWPEAFVTVTVNRAVEQTVMAPNC